MSLENDVITLLAKTFDVPEREISTQTKPKDIEGWDSVGHIMLVAELERSFHIEIPLDQIPELTSVQKIAACVRACAATDQI